MSLLTVKMTMSSYIAVVPSIVLPVLMWPHCDSMSGKQANVRAAQCLTTSISLFTDCQPFLKTLVDNGGTLSGTTILGLLTIAQNTTADTV